MRRMDKEFEKRGITWETDDYDIIVKGKIDDCRKVVEITDQFLITVFYSQVLDPEFHIFDRKTLEMIAVQDVYPHQLLGGKTRTWGSAVYE